MRIGTDEKKRNKAAIKVECAHGRLRVVSDLYAQLVYLKSVYLSDVTGRKRIALDSAVSAGSDLMGSTPEIN